MDKKQHLIDVQTIRSKEQIEDMKWSLKLFNDNKVVELIIKSFEK